MRVELRRLTSLGFSFVRTAGHKLRTVRLIGQQRSREAKRLDFDLDLAELGFLVSENFIDVTH